MKKPQEINKQELLDSIQDNIAPLPMKVRREVLLAIRILMKL